MTSADSLNTEGAEFHTRGDFVAAKVFYDAALRVDPYNFPALMNSIDLCSRENKLVTAAAYALRATVIAPTNPTAWNHYGNILFRLERYPESRIALERALSLGSDSPASWHNLLLLCLRQKRFEEALACYERLASLGGANPHTENDLAHAFLMNGDLESAYCPYEARWHTLRHLEPWDLHILQWTGQHLLGKKILIHSEQGYGDTLMVSRFIYELVTRGAEVTFAVPPKLVRFFEAQDWSIDVVNIHKIDESWGDRFDFHSPLYSMMRWLKIKKSDIDSKPYFKIPELTTPNVYPDYFNVGICWASGARGNEMDWRRRVSPLESWLKLTEIPTVHLWSLFPGKEAQDEIIKLGAESLVLDSVSNFECFAETAAFIDKLDLVISVDTAVVHLAAGLGKLTWMVSQFTPCWRWWDISNGTGDPWYQSLSIVPQNEKGNWDSQIRECGVRLSRIIENRMNKRMEIAA